jgi:hypothetical protein
LPACLNDTSTDQSICGPAILDTGTPGIIAYNGTNHAPLWSPGDATALNFSTTGSGGPNVSFAADRFPGSGLLQEPAAAGPALVAGMLPFFAYSVFYDAANGIIGLKPRPDAPNMQTVPPATMVENSDTQIEVITINAPGASTSQSTPTGAAALPLPQVITPTQ